MNDNQFLREVEAQLAAETAPQRRRAASLGCGIVLFSAAIGTGLIVLLVLLILKLTGAA